VRGYSESISRAAARQGYIRKGQKNERKLNMKSWKIIFTTVLSALVCFGLLPGAQAVGPEAPDTALAGGNTADGQLALGSVTSGIYNSAFGFYSLLSNTDASFNTGVGAGTLLLSDGTQNTAVGAGALLSNTTADSNTAVGTFAMFVNSSGTDNTAVGDEALEFNVSAFTNAAVGTFALQNNDSSGNTTANFNTAVGGFALRANVDGTSNTAVGAGAIESGDGGNDNTAVGLLAGNNITGNSNSCFGTSAGSNLTGGEGNIYIGAQVQAGATGELEFIRIGNDTAFTFPYDTYIAGIFNRSVDVGTAQFVFADANGKIGTVPVDAAGNKVATPQAMLNESRNQQKRIGELEGTVARLAGMVKEQAAQIQKVSAQLEVNKPAPKVVANKQ
jgi:hypothetical protein